jgi:hypothetical protein
MLCRLAFADALAKVADPVVQQELPIEAMLSQERATQRYKQYYDPNKVGVHKLLLKNKLLFKSKLLKK